jgi:hypothetical protein
MKNFTYYKKAVYTLSRIELFLQIEVSALHGTEDPGAGCEALGAGCEAIGGPAICILS